MITAAACVEFQESDVKEKMMTVHFAAEEASALDTVQGCVLGRIRERSSYRCAAITRDRNVSYPGRVCIYPLGDDSQPFLTGHHQPVSVHPGTLRGLGTASQSWIVAAPRMSTSTPYTF